MNIGVINLLDVCREGSYALGPGLRYVIWTKGCPFNCSGCITPEGKDISGGYVVDIKDLVEDIVNNPQLFGITISGGEPFLQAEALSETLSLIKKNRPDINVLIFSGYKIEDLIWPEAKKVLSLTDVLIDGKYVDDLNDGIGLRGSSNQRIHYLTERLISYRHSLEHGKRDVEIYLDGKQLKTIGIPQLKNKLS